MRLQGRDYSYYSLKTLAEQSAADLSHLPYVLRILLEGCVRRSGQMGFSTEHIQSILAWHPQPLQDRPPVPFLPARILMQDFTGVPVLNDLTALRSALQKRKKSPSIVNPIMPVDVVIDHSVQVSAYGCPEARSINEELEFDQNFERYQFLKWSEAAYQKLRVLPPGLGICHQVNLEYLGQVAFVQTSDNERLVYPDSVLGTDSHTPMINGLGILGWGVGGIEALAAMLGYPSEFVLPDVIGVELKGSLSAPATPTDLTLTLTHRLRELGVVGKFVEVYGEGCQNLPVETRAMMANMSPESGATATYFPVDHLTLDYLHRTGRTAQHTDLVQAYFQEQGLFRFTDSILPAYSHVISIQLDEIKPLLAGPKRPQDIFLFSDAPHSFRQSLTAPLGHSGFGLQDGATPSLEVNLDGQTCELSHGAVLIAAITSCTNTSDASVMLAAGLLASNAARLGLKSKPWVKTSLAPGSRVVSQYLEKAGLLPGLEALGFHTVGYGCTTCIGNSGPLDLPIHQALSTSNLVGAAVLSGNRNFDGRIHPDVKASYLMSPPLVVAYALAGYMDFNFQSTPLGNDHHGKPVFLRDIYPSPAEVDAFMRQTLDTDMYVQNYENLYTGNPRWNAMRIPGQLIYPWQPASTLLKEPEFLLDDSHLFQKADSLSGMHALAVLGDSVTTDHISPAGSIAPDNPAGVYLQSLGVTAQEFISFGARRGNHEVMLRGTFSNPRLSNRLSPDCSGGFTRHIPSGEIISIYDAAQKYRHAGIPLIILAGKAYGSGSSRDWAAKGACLLGIRAVIAESYERIHRTNLVCLGVLPLQFKAGQNVQSLGISGLERFTLSGLEALQAAHPELTVTAEAQDGTSQVFNVSVLIETPLEMAYYKAGGLARKILMDLD